MGFAAGYIVIVLVLDWVAGRQVFSTSSAATFSSMILPP